MSHRARLGPIANAARARPRELHERAIVEAVAKRPPRVEVRRVPAMAPIEQPLPNAGWHVIDLNKRPEHRSVVAPIIAPNVLRLQSDNRSILYELFQAKEYRLDVKTSPGDLDKCSGTRVRWWTFEPTREALKPDVRHGLNRARSYAARVEFALDDIARFFSPAWMLASFRDLREWVAVVREDIDQALGDP